MARNRAFEAQAGHPWKTYLTELAQPENSSTDGAVYAEDAAHRKKHQITNLKSQTNLKHEYTNGRRTARSFKSWTLVLVLRFDG
jgi:hypothetical protein